MNGFRSLHNAAQRQCLRAGKLAHGGKACLAQFSGRAAGMPSDQANQIFLLPGMPPVVDGLMTDAALLANHIRMFSLTQHQQSRRAQSRIPPGMIDRQLEQRCAFAGAQDQGYFHRTLSGFRS